MKNIHVLPTDKPSRLYINISEELSFTSIEFTQQKNEFNTNQNIYITSDEEIKDGDYYLYLKNNSIKQFIKKHHTKLLALDIQKKIILTTDQDLIKDGVQVIDDEFLEWFVKNPSCERVEVKDIYFHGSGYYDDNQLSEQEKVLYSSMKEYKIIIPKEESFIEYTNTNDCTSMIYKGIERQIYKQVIAERYYEDEVSINAFINGYKLAQEQILDFLYSEIRERRDYSASKMCEKVIEFIGTI